MKPTVLITRDGAPRGATPSRVVQRAALAMLEALELDDVELSVLLCNDAVIHELNKTYRKKDKPTDVLAFALREGAHGNTAGGALGDVVISLETAARQAQDHEITLESEVLALLAHGLLHLLGWDHRTAAEDRRMRRETERLVAACRSVDRTPRRRAQGT